VSEARAAGERKSEAHRMAKQDSVAGTPYPPGPSFDA